MCSYTYVTITGTAWKNINTFIFRGTNILGTPVSVQTIANIKAGSTAAIQLYDITNSLVIAEIDLTTANTAMAIFSTTTLANLPTGPVMMAVRAKGNSSTYQVYVYSFSIFFS